MHRSVRVLLIVGTLAGCMPPPGPYMDPDAVAVEQELQREREIYAGSLRKETDPLGRLEVFTGSLLTDGRTLKIRGKLRNPYAEPVDGVRVVFQIFSKEDATRALDTQYDEKSIEIAPGDTTALRLDVQTMYAGSEGGGKFSVEAYAKRVGDRDIPPPPGWED
jgi:hypothetical protein